MPILLTVRRNLGCPIFYCDRCKGEIERAEDGVYAFLGTRDGKACMDPEPICYFHHDCFVRLETTDDGHELFWGCRPLTIFPALLKNNLKLTQEDLEAAVTSEARLNQMFS